MTLAYSLPACSSPTAWQMSVCQKTVSPGMTSGIETSAGHQIGVPLRADAERAAGRGPAEIVLRHVVLQRAQEHVGRCPRRWE